MFYNLLFDIIKLMPFVCMWAALGDVMVLFVGLVVGTRHCLVPGGLSSHSNVLNKEKWVN
jgi:hypothetical protein